MTDRIAPQELRQKSALRRPMGSARRFALNRDLLPTTAVFYQKEGIKLLGAGGWRDAVCPFHKDTNPSMRVFFETGAFRCMTCGAHGGDVVAFHMLRHGVGFVVAAKAHGAWKVVR